MGPDYHHVRGRTVSPCMGCEKRRPGYACLRTCNLPKRYVNSLGTMSGSVPMPMTPQGRDLSFTPAPAPGHSAMYSVSAKIQAASRGSHGKHKKAAAPTTESRPCRFPGCNGVAGKGHYCRKHHRLIYYRIKILKWSPEMAYMPSGTRRDMMSAFSRAHNKMEARRDYEAGMMKFQDRKVMR